MTGTTENHQVEIKSKLYTSLTTHTLAFAITEGDGTTQNFQQIMPLGSDGTVTFNPQSFTFARGMVANGENIITINASDGANAIAVNYPVYYYTNWTGIMYFDGDQDGQGNDASDLTTALNNNINDISSAVASSSNQSSADFYILFGGDTSDQFIKIPNSSPSLFTVNNIDSSWGNGTRVNMGDWHSLEEFADYVMTNCPSDHYWIDINNHGKGWDGLCEDDTTKNNNGLPSWMTLSDIKSAMNVINTLAKSQGNYVDVLSFDGCIMAMPEVLDALQSDCNYMIASEETIPAFGYPYNSIVSDLLANLYTPAAFSSQIVNDYYNYYSQIDTTDIATLAAFDMTKFSSSGIINNISSFASTIFAQLPVDSDVISALSFGTGVNSPAAYQNYRQINPLRNILAATQRYGFFYDSTTRKGSGFIGMWPADIINLASQLGTTINSGNLIINNKPNQINTSFYDSNSDNNMYSSYNGTNLNDSNSNGLAIYFPPFIPGLRLLFRSNYGTLDFASDCSSWATNIQDNSNQNNGMFQVWAKDITGPDFVNAPAATGNAITALGQVVPFSYTLNENSEVFYEIADAASGGNVLGTLTVAPVAVFGNSNIAINIQGTYFDSSGNERLLPNNTNGYYIRIYMMETVDNDGAMYVDPNTLNPYYLIGPITINIPSKPVFFNITTPQNPSGYVITVPNDTVTAIYNDPNNNNNPVTVAQTTLASGTGNISLPEGVAYNISISKAGYVTYTNSLTTTNDSSSQNFPTPVNVAYNSINCFRPLMPYIPGSAGRNAESGYDSTVSSGGDGIPDGWKYYYWSQWQNWVPADGCNLSQNDSGVSASTLYNPNPAPATTPVPGDGLTEMDKYNLQQAPLSLPVDPRYDDLIVELDWLNGGPVPVTTVSNTAINILNQAGVNLHCVPGKAITPLSGMSLTSSAVDMANLFSVVNTATTGGSYNNVSTNKIAHAVYVPAYTQITDTSMLPNAVNQSLGGLYWNLQNSSNYPGIIIFDLNAKNVGDVKSLSANPDYAQAEGNFLAHELGHVLGYAETTTITASSARMADDIMALYMSTTTTSNIGLFAYSGQPRHFYADEIAGFSFINNKLYGDFMEEVSFKPQIYQEQPALTINAYAEAWQPVTFTVNVFDMGCNPQYVTCTVNYSTNGGTSYSAVTLTEQSSSTVLHGMFNYAGYIPGQASGTVVTYYIEAVDANGAVATLPDLAGNTLPPPPATYQYTVISPPSLILSEWPNPFSPNINGMAQTMYVSCTAMAGSTFMQSLQLQVIDSSGNTRYSWPVSNNTTGSGSNVFMWNGAGVPDGNYTVTATGVDQAGNTDTASVPFVLEASAPTITGQFIQVVPGATAGVFTAQDTAVNVTFSVQDKYSSSVMVTAIFSLQVSSAYFSVTKTVVIANTAPGTPISGTISWDGTNSMGRVAPDGAYTVTLIAVNSANNSTSPINVWTINGISVPLIVDRTAPQITSIYANNYIFYPDITGTPSVSILNFTVQSQNSLSSLQASVNVQNANGQIVSGPSAVVMVASGNGAYTGSFTWNGQTTGSAYVADGVYTYSLLVSDMYGDTSIAGVTVIKDGIPAQITNPTAGATVGGNVIIDGTAVDPYLNASNFADYKLWYRAGNAQWTGNTGNGWTLAPISVPVSYQSATDTAYPNSNVSYRPIMNGLLGVWNTAGVQPGPYTIVLASHDINSSQRSWASAAITVTSSTFLLAPAVNITAPIMTGTQAYTVTLNTPSDMVSGSYTLNLSGSSYANVALDIIQMNGSTYGSVVFHQDFMNETTGNSFNWNGNSVTGTAEPNGAYIIQLTPYGSNGQAGTPQTIEIYLINNITNPLSITQLQVSPNPVSPGASSSIFFESSQNVTASVEIDNLQGQLVQSLESNAGVQAGMVQQLNWTTSSAGLYSCKITLSNSFGQTTSASQVIEVTGGATGSAGTIAYPAAGTAVNGVTMMNWSASAEGTYYPPQTFTAQVTVNGYVNNCPQGSSQTFSWAIAAETTETDNYAFSSSNLNGATAGSVQDGGVDQTYFKGNNCANGSVECYVPGVGVLTVQHSEWATQEITYPVTFSGTVPVPSVSCTNDAEYAYNNKENDNRIQSYNANGFTAQGYIYENNYDTDSGYCQLYSSYEPSAISGISFTWSVSGQVVTPIYVTMTGVCTISPGSTTTTAFNITLSPQHGGTIDASTIQIVGIIPAGGVTTGTYFPGSSDFDNSSLISSSIVGTPVVNGDTISGTLQFTDIAPYTQAAWSTTFTVDGSVNTEWANWTPANPGCYNNHPLTSQTLSSFYTLPPQTVTTVFEGFSNSKYTVSAPNNSNVSLALNGETLTASTGLAFTWTSSSDQNLAAASGLITQYGQDFNGSTVNTYFITESAPFAYSSSYPYPGTVMNSNASTMNQYTFWWTSSGTTITAQQNPYVSVDASKVGSWNVNMNYADNSSLGNSLNADFQPDMQYTGAANTAKDPVTGLPYNYTNEFKMQMNTGAAPQTFVPIIGSATGVYALFYQSASSTSGAWYSIPALSTGTVSAGGTLGYWNVTGLNGPYTLKLAAQNGNSVEETYQNVTAGTLVTAVSGGTVLGPCNKAYLQIPAGALNQDTVISISAQKLSQSGINYDPTAPLPIGAVYDMQPNGLSFTSAAMMSIRLLPSEISGLNLSGFQVYDVEPDGTLQAISSGVTQVTESSGDTNPVQITRIDFPITHFSHYLILPAMKAPVLNMPVSPTDMSAITITGSAAAGTLVQLYDNGVSEGNVMAGSNGTFSIPVYLTQGGNTITAVSSQYLAKGSIVSLVSKPVQVILDATGPQIQGLSVSPTAYCAGSGSTVAISWNLSEPAAEACTVTCAIYDSANNLTRTVLSGAPVTVSSATWDGNTSLGTLAAGGRYTVLVSAIDAAGNSSQATCKVYVGCRLDAPATSLILGYPSYVDASGNTFVSAATAISLVATDGQSQAFNWAIAATGTETYAIQVSKSLSQSQIGGSDAGTYQEGLFLFNMPGQGSYYAERKEWVQITVNYRDYGVTFTNPPNLTVNCPEDGISFMGGAPSSTLQIVNNTTTGFTVKDWIFEDIENNPPIGLIVEQWYPCAPNQLPFNWFATGTIAQTITATAPISVTLTGSYTMTPETNINQAFTITLLPQHGGIIDLSTIQIVGLAQGGGVTTGTYFSGSNDFDDSNLISSSIAGTPVVNGNTISGTLQFTDYVSISGISYRIKGGTWTTVTGSAATVPLGSVPGTYELDYHSRDNLGNTEKLHKATLNLDTAPPITQINIGSPAYTSPTGQGYTFVTGMTPFTLSALDPSQNGESSGVRAVYYRLGAGAWVTGTSFTLSGVPDGNEIISYYSVDNLNQCEVIHSLTVTVDNSAPVIELREACQGCPYQGVLEMQSGGTVYLSDPSYTVVPDVMDAESGVASISFQVDSGAWTQYSWTALKTVLAGQVNHTLAITAVDNVGNSSTFYASILRVPSPTVTNTATQTFTASPTPSSTATGSSTPTATETVTPTSSWTTTNTSTATTTDTPTGTATNTATSTSTPTNTPTSTATKTITPTSSWTPTNTPTATATSSSTSSFTSTFTPSPTNTSSPTATPTSTPVICVDQAIAACSGQILINGQGLVDSYRSSRGTYGNMTFNNGNLQAAKKVILIGNIKINGTIIENQAPLQMPVPVEGNPTNLGNYVIGDNKIVNIFGGDYLADSFKIGCNAKLIAMGSVRIWVNGPIQIGDKSVIQPISNIPGDFWLIGMNEMTQICFDGKIDYEGVIYSPKSNINLSGDCTVIGAIVGASVTIQGNIMMHYDEDLSCIPFIDLSPTNTITISPSMTNTLTVTSTITNTMTISHTTATLTITATPTTAITPTNTEVPGLCFRLEYMPKIEKIWTSTIMPEIILTNCSKEDIDLSKLQIRYYYNVNDYNAKEASGIIYAMKFDEFCNGNEEYCFDRNFNEEKGKEDIIKCTESYLLKMQGNCLNKNILDIEFEKCAGELQQGGKLALSVFIERKDNGTYCQDNDYSFGLCKSWKETDKICIYYDGYLVWGNEPSCAGPTATVTPIEMMHCMNIGKETPTIIGDINESSVYNFPNPCSNETTIRFILTTLEDVNIGIFDINGRYIWGRKLYSSDVNYGINYATWNCTNENGLQVANGVYICKIIIGRKEITKYIAVIK